MKDSSFIRGSAPMTKEEIRTLALNKLDLQATDWLLDVGAGTGSVSIEAALRLPRGRVIALERNAGTIELIRQNCQRHNVTNLDIIEAEAPQGMENLEHINKYFIGGSGGQLEAILDQIAAKAPGNSLIVLTAIVVDTMMNAYTYFKKAEWPFELAQVSVSKVDTQAAVAMLKAHNPVFLFTAIKPLNK